MKCDVCGTAIMDALVAATGEGELYANGIRINPGGPHRYCFECIAKAINVGARYGPPPVPPPPTPRAGEPAPFDAEAFLSNMGDLDGPVSETFNDVAQLAHDEGRTHGMRASLALLDRYAEVCRKNAEGGKDDRGGATPESWSWQAAANHVGNVGQAIRDMLEEVTTNGETGPD